jgi:hypothetical protein
VSGRATSVPRVGPPTGRYGPERPQDGHDHRRALRACGTLRFGGWLDPDGTAHACQYWPGADRAVSVVVAQGRAHRRVAHLGPAPTWTAVTLRRAPLTAAGILSADGWPRR